MIRRLLTCAAVALFITLTAASPVLAKKEFTYTTTVTYDYVGSFSEGLAWVRLNDKEFHIRPNGSPAYDERYDDVWPFSEGLAWVRLDGKVFKIRPDGSRVD